MSRREFFKNTIKMGATAGVAMSLGKYGDLLAKELPLQKSAYDLVAIKGGEPDALFDSAMKAFGGMRQFVKPNQTVTIKPNIGWDTLPERGADTNPILIKQIIKHCRDAGAKKVYVFDHTADVWKNCYKNSGIEKAVEDAGGTMVPGNNMSYYHEVKIPKGISLKSTKVHELYLESDVFINVPILKHHVATKLSLGMKNLMGVVWDRGWWHNNDLNQCVADFMTFKKPDLTIMDAYYVLKRNGPMGVTTNDVLTMKSQLIATDPVAIDAAATKLFGWEPGKIGYIPLANNLGVGEKDLSKLSIHKIKI